ncbi:alpha/beta hydrolase [Candidatus Leptofilum sp.]|uniref:alpha/beta hydrolase n=1 Tax=Candidatus Leptofilum sp. TaxID=3241576 RepID=UPI003B5AB68D
MWEVVSTAVFNYRIFIMPKLNYKVPIVIVLLLLVGLAGFVHSRARRLVSPPRTFTHETPSDYGIADWQEVTFATEDDLQLAGWYVPPQGRGGATIIFVHGLGSNRGALLNQAAMLAEKGYGALLFDLRAHGRSEGHKSSWGLDEVEDVKAALSFLQSKPEVDPGKIGLAGHSMGGAIAIRAAAQLPEIRLVVAESVYTNFTDNQHRLTVAFARLPEWTAPVIMRWAEWIAGVDSSQLAPLTEVASLSPRPILFIQGGRDKIVHVSNGSTLYETAVSPKERLLIPNADHTNLFETGPELMTKRMRRFMADFLTER